MPPLTGLLETSLYVGDLARSRRFYEELFGRGATHMGRGGCSVYFRDPDGHLLELATPGVWINY